MIVAAMDTEGEKTQVAVPLSRYFWDPLDSLPAGCPSASLGQGVMSYWFRSLSLARYLISGRCSINVPNPCAFSICLCDDD